MFIELSGLDRQHVRASEVVSYKIAFSESPGKYCLEVTLNNGHIVRSENVYRLSEAETELERFSKLLKSL